VNQHAFELARLVRMKLATSESQLAFSPKARSTRVSGAFVRMKLAFEGSES
jgi:hypothetical protein